MLNALDPEDNPYEEESADSTTEWPTGAEPVEIPAGSNIVMASTYGLYTKSPDSTQDAVIKATLYWDEDADTCFAIRFKGGSDPVAGYRQHQRLGLCAGCGRSGKVGRRRDPLQRTGH